MSPTSDQWVEMKQPGSNPPRKPARDRARTEHELIEAVGRVLARDGFQSLGVNTVARAAGTDKVLIYRYFGDLAGLMRAYGDSADFWPTVDEVLGPDPESLRALPPGPRISRIVTRLLKALSARPQTIEILAWETVQVNALTAMLADVRERWSRDIIARAMPDAKASDTDWVALADLLVAGFQYLLIRSRTVPEYGGINLSTEAGWARIENAIRTACGDIQHGEHGRTT